MPTHLKTEWLIAFQAVLLTGTVTDAATRVLRTQPQVSRMIRALETTLGLTLFEREGRRLIPTQAALRFADYIAPTLKMLDGLEIFVEDTQQNRHRPLIAQAEPFLMQNLVPASMERFARFETRRLSLELCARTVGLWQNRSDADLAIVALPYPQTDFIAVPFAEAEIVVVTPPGHALAQQDRVSMRDLTEHPLVALRPTTLMRGQIDDLAAAEGYSLRPMIETDSGTAAVDLVSRGFGVALADPLVALSFRHAGIGITRLSSRLTIQYGFLLRRTDHGDLIGRTMRTFRETAKELGGDFIRLL